MTAVPGGDLEAGWAAPALRPAPGRGRLPGWVQAGVRWTVEHRLVLATGLVAAIPVIASTVRAIGAGWVPLGDDGTIAVRSFDVFTTHSPLLGQYSNSSGVTGQELHSLGPLLYWLLALPVRFLGYSAPAVTVGLVNGACVMGIVALARRRGGVPLMIAAAVGVVLMCGSLPAEIFHDVWNPAVAIMPFTLLMFLGWSIGCGEHRLLPLAVGVASFVAQCHMTYVLPALGLLAIGLVGLVLTRRAAPPAGRAPLRRWIVATVLVGAVCWSAPLVDQASHRPGNLVILARTAAKHKATLGATAGWHAVVHAVGIPPWWVRSAPEPISRLHDLSARPGAVDALGVVSGLAILGAVAGVGLVARRRRRFDIVFACAISLVLCAALGLSMASTPTKDNLFYAVGYSSWWGSPAGMWVWLALGWSVTSLLGPLRRPVGPRVARLAPLAALGAAAAVAALVVANAGPDPLRSAFRPVRTIIDRVDAQVPRHQTVLVDSAATFTGVDFMPPTVLALRRRGTPVVSAALLPALGGAYDPAVRHPQLVLRIDEGDKPAPPGGKVIARVPVHSPGGRSFGQLRPAEGLVTVTLAPAPRAVR
jgi:hypothetical protein